MSKIKKSMIFVLYVLTAVLMSFSLFGCSDSESKEDEKYDVAIRIGCSDRNIYEFSVGENEKHVTIPYDGMERTYWVDSYNLPDHPRYGDDWFSPSGEGANVFEMSIVGDTGEVEYIRDKGSYCVNTYADSTSTLWNFRHVWLFVDIV